MKQGSFKDSEVIRYLDENYVSIKINTDQHKEFAMKWKIKGLPSLWFLDSSGNKLSNIPGYVDKERFLLILEYIRTQDYDKTSFQEFVEQRS